MVFHEISKCFAACFHEFFKYFKKTCSARISIIRQFALFLSSLGIETYIPSNFYKVEKKVVHILSDAEIIAFFEEADGYVPAIDIIGFHRLATEYKVIFRLIYCCGLRISEARKLCWNDVDLKQGTIRILQSKGHKDRLIYLSSNKGFQLTTDIYSHKRAERQDVSGKRRTYHKKICV